MKSHKDLPKRKSGSRLMSLVWDYFFGFIERATVKAGFGPSEKPRLGRKSTRRRKTITVDTQGRFFKGTRRPKSHLKRNLSTTFQKTPKNYVFFILFSSSRCVFVNIFILFCLIIGRCKKLLLRWLHGRSEIHVDRRGSRLQACTLIRWFGCC